MKFQKPQISELESRIASQIDVKCSISYGHIGSNYLCVLVVIDGEIHCIGELLYRIEREELYKYPVICLNTPEDFGRACNEYLLDMRDKLPSWHLVNGILSIV